MPPPPPRSPGCAAAGGHGGNGVGVSPARRAWHRVHGAPDGKSVLALAVALIAGLALASFAHGIMVHSSVSGGAKAARAPAYSAPADGQLQRRAAEDSAGAAAGGGGDGAIVYSGTAPPVEADASGIHAASPVTAPSSPLSSSRPHTAPFPPLPLPRKGGPARCALPLSAGADCHPGALVRATWGGNGRRYRAVVRAVDADGYVTVDWCDGGTSHRRLPHHLAGCAWPPGATPGPEPSTGAALRGAARPSDPLRGGGRGAPRRRSMADAAGGSEASDDGVAGGGEAEADFEAWWRWWRRRRKRDPPAPTLSALPEAPAGGAAAGESQPADPELEALQQELAQKRAKLRKDSAARQLRERIAVLERESEEALAWEKEVARERERERERTREMWAERVDQHARWRRAQERERGDAARDEAAWLRPQAAAAPAPPPVAGKLQKSDECPGMAVPPVAHYAEVSKKMTNPQYAYATFVTSADFVIPAAVVMHSVAVAGCSYARVIAVTSDVPRSDIELLSSFGQVVLIQKIGAPRFVDNPRYKDTFTKLRIWQLTRWQKIFYLDTDVIVTRNIDDVFDLKEWSVPYDAMHDRYSTGMMLLEPSLDTFSDMMTKLQTTSVSMELPDLLFLKEYFEEKKKRINIIPRWYQVYQEEFGAYRLTYLTDQKAAIKIFDPRIRGIHYPGANKPFNNIDALQARWGHLLCDWADRDELAYEPHFLWLWAHALMRRDLATLRSRALFSHEQVQGGVVIDIAKAVEEDEQKRKEDAAKVTPWTPPVWVWTPPPWMTPPAASGVPTTAADALPPPAPPAVGAGGAPAAPAAPAAPRFVGKQCSVTTVDGLIDLTPLEPVQFTLPVRRQQGLGEDGEEYQWVLTWCTLAHMAPEGTRECVRATHFAQYSWGFCRGAFDQGMRLDAMPDATGAVLRAEAPAQGPRAKRVLEARLHCSLEPGYHDVWLNSSSIDVSVDNATGALVHEVHLLSPCFCPGLCSANDTAPDRLELPAAGARTRRDGRCGAAYPLASGAPAECDYAASKDLAGPCCSDKGYCGPTAEHCRCPGCVDYSKVYREARRRDKEVKEFRRRLAEIGEGERVAAAAPAGLLEPPVALAEAEEGAGSGRENDSEGLFAINASSSPERGARTPPARPGYRLRRDGTRCDAFSVPISSAAECAAAARALELPRVEYAESGEVYLTHPCNTQNPRGCYLNARSGRLYWNPCGDPESAAPDRQSVCREDAEPLALCLIDNRWRSPGQVARMTPAEKREAIAGELDELALRMGWPVAEHEGKSAAALAALCPKVPGAAAARTPLRPREADTSLLPPPDIARRLRYAGQRLRRKQREVEERAAYDRAEREAGALLGADYEAMLAARRSRSVERQAGEGARQAAGIERGEERPERPEADAPVEAEVPFVDPQGDTVVFTRSGAGAMRYSVNGEARPPLRRIKYDPAAGELLFQDIQRRLRLPAAGRGRVLDRLRRLAAAAGVRHDIPMQNLRWAQEVTLGDLEQEKLRAIQAEDYEAAARLATEIRRRQVAELSDLVALKAAAVAREDFEAAKELRDRIRRLNATMQGGAQPAPAAVNFTKGQTVRLTTRILFKSGRELPAGTTAVIERVPGQKQGSPATARAGRLLFDLRPAQAEPVASAPSAPPRSARRVVLQPVPQGGPRAPRQRTLDFVKDAQGKVGVSYKGTRVIAVRAGSPAERAGIEVGAEIKTIAGEAVHTASDVRAAFQNAPDRFTVSVALASDAPAPAAPHDVLGEAPSETVDAADSPPAHEHKAAGAAPRRPPPSSAGPQRSPAAPGPANASLAANASAVNATGANTTNATANATDVQKEGPIAAGTRVRFRDRGQAWRTGTVSRVREDGTPLVAMREGGLAFAWDEVESDEGPCPGGGLSGCVALCQQEDAAKLRDCVAECVRACPADAASGGATRPPGAAADAPLRPGDRVRVGEQLRSNSRSKVLLREGLMGTVETVDSDGDALITFDGVPQRQWVFARNFARLVRVDECSEVNATASAAAGFTEGPVPLFQVCVPLRSSTPSVAAVVPFAAAAAGSAGVHLQELERLREAELQGVANLSVVDVGAGAGFFALGAAALGATVEAFEPLELNAAALRCGLRLLPAPAAKNFTVRAVALAQEARADCIAISPSLPDTPSPAAAPASAPPSAAAAPAAAAVQAPSESASPAPPTPAPTPLPPQRAPPPSGGNASTAAAAAAAGAQVRCGDRRVEVLALGVSGGGSDSRRVRHPRVAAQRGDATLPQRRVHVLRVSTGGMEAEVLQGLSGVFGGLGVDFAAVEVPLAPAAGAAADASGAALRRNADAVWAFLSARPYELLAGGFDGAALGADAWGKLTTEPQGSGAAADSGGGAVTLYARRRGRLGRRRRADGGAGGRGAAPHSELRDGKRVLRRSRR
eukprot:TRINITY_DN1167_c4_g1_i1.p1 TRINITY_DN1167_c4_g1~~TRINITY_DN1167_c4_g1_i1.p1  ORF type:complete len:2453 (+),score=705.32 TRINITY_DN1167_c4_g1_i1:152-7360(+)